MKNKNHIIPSIIFGLILSMVSSSNLAFQEQEKTEVEIIPKKVKTVIQEGMDTQQARLDIPFTIIKNLYLPAQQRMHTIFLFKVKNADLGFVSATPEAEAPEKKEKKEEEEEVSSFEATPTQLQAHAHIFLYFKQIDGPYEKEVYVPLNLQVDGISYVSDREDIYTVGYPIPPGKYLLSMAITSSNLEKIGTQYFQFSLPNAASFTEELETTPIFFARNINRMAAPEIRTEVHKDFFTYSILQIEPNMNNIFSPVENLDIFFFILGAELNEVGRNDIDVNYAVLKGEETAIRFAPSKCDSPLVSQPLPMKRTVVVKTTDKDGKATEKKEQRDLGPGKYTLTLDIKDNLSGKTLKKSIEFEIK
jgi:hypothetical protein